MSGEMLPQPAPMTAPPVFEPKRLKVFGVIHIVFGGLGLLYMVVNVVGLIFQEEIQKVSVAGQPAEMADFQREFNEATAASSWITIGVGLVVGVLILIAGIALVRRKKNSLKLSNTYAWVSLGAKVLAIIIFVTMISPAINGLIDGMVEEATPDMKQGMNAVKIATVGFGVLIPILMSIYPILSLVMLNKPKVKDFLAQQGT